MSINPAHEIAENLRNTESTNFESAAPNTSIRSRANTDEYPLTVDRVEGLDIAPDETTMADKMDGSLPDDDGMKDLRQKLHAIRTLVVSTEEKARRMHSLMTRDYRGHEASVGPSPTLAGMEKNGDAASPAVSELAPPIDPKNPYNIRPADLEPSFSPLPFVRIDSNADALDNTDDDTTAVLGCMHYKRNVKVQCFDCHRWFPCRHCHDQSQDLQFPHQLNRKKTQNMLCMLCRTPQPAAEMCMNCGEYSAWYYCPKCKLWDNDSNKRIYHCDDCGICRVGEGLGKDYVHCKRCNVCISISTSPSHPCIERATEGDCPLCLVRLFESQTPVVSLPCGHYMHGECYKDLMAVTYKCPVCSKSAVNMELQWRKVDDEIRAQPMPDDDEELEGLLPAASSGEPELTADADVSGQESRYRRPRTVWIGCNDCGRRSWTAFHWLGLKCQLCDSYNTNQMPPTAVRETEAERVIRQQQQHHLQHDFTGHAVLRDTGTGVGVEAQQRRVDSALDVPSSPSQLPTSSSSSSEQRRASGAQSPGRRYFVQEEEQRRPSFTSPRFSTPSIPNLPNLPEMPRLPRMPNLPRPSMPNIPTLPNMPNMPRMPDMQNFELPRFSPYEMFDAVSRSLSPMRYYLRGLEGREAEMRVGRDGLRSANRSPTSVHSDPTAGASSSRKPRSSGHDVRDDDDDDAVEFLDSDGAVVSGNDDDGDDDDSIHAIDNDEEASSNSESEHTDDDMDEDGADIGNEEEDEDEDMELFGHR